MKGFAPMLGENDIDRIREIIKPVEVKLDSIIKANEVALITTEKRHEECKANLCKDIADKKAEIDAVKLDVKKNSDRIWNIKVFLAGSGIVGSAVAGGILNAFGLI